MTDQSKDRISGTFDETKGKVKETVGRETGNEDLQGEGKMDQASGAVKKGVADAKDAIDGLVKKVTNKDDK